MHISDLTLLYGQILDKILRKEQIPNGTEGYYFAWGHHYVWWELIDHVGKNLAARGLIADSEAKIWPNDEFVAETFSIPVPLVQIFWNAR